MTCKYCNRPNQILLNGKIIEDKDFILGLAEFYKFGDGLLCDCKNRLNDCKRQVNEMKIVEDSDWILDNFSSKPIRGLRDYNRKIVFNKELDVNDVSVVKTWLILDNCPGHTGISFYKQNNTTYLFCTTCDSSD